MALKDRPILFKAAAAGALAAALALSGCGRNGAPEPPPGAVTTKPDHTATTTTGQATPKKPDKPFFLDFLI